MTRHICEHCSQEHTPCCVECPCRRSGIPDFKAGLRTARKFVLDQGGTLAPESIVRNRSKHD